MDSGDPAQSRAFMVRVGGPTGPLMVRDLATLEVAELNSLDELAEALTDWLSQAPVASDVPLLSDCLPELTETEARVGALAVEGIANKAIAAALDIRLRTVESHLTSTYSKLGVKSRRELARLVKERTR